MSRHDWLLVLHVTGAFLLVSGSVVAGVLQLAAMRRERPSEIAILFRLSRVAVVLVGIGAVAALAFGLWLASDGHDFGRAWVIAALVLYASSIALGAIGGRTFKRTRELAERLWADGDRPHPELSRLVRDPHVLAVNYASLAALIAILGLMAWQPS